MTLHETLHVLRGATWNGARALTFRVSPNTAGDDAPGSPSPGETPLVLQGEALASPEACIAAYRDWQKASPVLPRQVEIEGVPVTVGCSAAETSVPVERDEWFREVDPVAEIAADRARVVYDAVALVTGGAQGFGFEIARGLAHAGAQLILADLNEEGARARAAELNEMTGRACASAVAVDVTDEASVAAMFDRATEYYGGVDLVVSNAGVLKAGSVKDFDREDFDFVTKVNYTGFFLVSKYASRLLASQNAASRIAGRPPYFSDIVEINSKSGLVGSNKNGAYAGSKFGGIGLVQSFALELVRDNIKVNAICPGNFFDGPLWSDPDRGLFTQYLKAGKVPGATTIADVRRAYEEKVPMGRGATGLDVVRAILAVVEQRYETGQAVPVTGGQEMLR